MIKIFRIILAWLSLFGMFVPFGYLNWYWATPIAVASFFIFTGLVLKTYKESNTND